jgi:hypothetical protein
LYVFACTVSTMVVDLPVAKVVLFADILLEGCPVCCWCMYLRLSVAGIEPQTFLTNYFHNNVFIGL